MQDVRVIFCDEEEYGDEHWGWYVVGPDGDGIGPLDDKDDAHAWASEIRAHGWPVEGRRTA